MNSIKGRLSGSILCSGNFSCMLVKPADRRNHANKAYLERDESLDSIALARTEWQNEKSSAIIGRKYKSKDSSVLERWSIRSTIELCNRGEVIYIEQ